METNEDEHQGGDTSGEEEGIRSAKVSHKEGMLEPPLTQSRTSTRSFAFNDVHFYKYLDDHLSQLHSRLDTIDECQ